jgi:hypothetical protein
MIQDFNTWLGNIEPHRIFHDSNLVWYEYHDGPHVEGSLFTGVYTSTGDHYTNYTYTRLGKFMNKLPILIEGIIKGIYYIITWPIYLCVKVPWMLFRGLFVPEGWL